MSILIRLSSIIILKLLFSFVRKKLATTRPFWLQIDESW